MSHTPIQLIVGLGNPGPQYDGTRHNAGARFVEALAHRYRIVLNSESRYFGRVGRGRIGSEEVRLLIPDTFMNLSGKSVLALANFFKILPPAILVAHDELDLPPGVVRLKQGGGHGGHNGLRDVIAALANSRDFCRLRLGIGHPGNSRDVVDYVLNRAPTDERDKLDAAIDASLDVIEDVVAGNWAQAQNRLHIFTA